MSKKLIYLTSFIMVLLPSLVSTVNAADAALVGWWKLDDGAGTTAIDSSGNGYNGTVNGGGTWTTGQVDGGYQFNGTNSYISAPHIPLDNRSFTIALWVNPTALTGLHTVFAQGTGATDSRVHIRVCGANTSGQGPVNGIRFAFYNNDQDTPTNILQVNTWYHVACVYDYENKARRIYVNGELLAHQDSGVNPFIATTGNTIIGAETANSNRFNGILDDVRVYTGVLTASQIHSLMTGVEGKSSNPIPENTETDVLNKTILSWDPGKFANTHNIYLGTDFNDVNDASTTDNSGLTVSLNQYDAFFSPGALEFNKTYYWRVDEVNAAPGYYVYRGDIWSFKVEPYTYPILSKYITAESSSNDTRKNPISTVNGSGLDGNDPPLHNTVGSDMWCSKRNAPEPAWIEYDFGKLYKVHELMVWNYNEVGSNRLNGIKDVKIEYTSDGTTWKEFKDVNQFECATGADRCPPSIYDFNDMLVRGVKLTALSNWGGEGYNRYGLAEIRFMRIPLRARYPYPEDDANNIALNETLAWRPGREAVTHKIYLSTDMQKVENGSASLGSVSETSYDLTDLMIDTTYYWRVDEVNNQASPKTWDGHIWAFKTVGNMILDDFEDYNDNEADGYAIWQNWLDGFPYPPTTDNGGQIGLDYAYAPWVEETIVQHGEQSAPFYYKNSTVNYSEAELPFSASRNFNNGADTINLYYRGRSVTFANLEEGEFAMSGSGYVWGSSDGCRYAYKQLTGDGSIIARVDSIQNTNAYAKAGVMIRDSFDDPNSSNGFVLLAGNGNIIFQRRVEGSGATANNSNLAGFDAPCWVKITRTGNVIKAERSADGQTWLPIGTNPDTPTQETITMSNPVYIGLAVSSNTGNSLAAATFSGVETTGNVSGDWQYVDIGSQQAEGENTIDKLYFAIKDNQGHTAKVYAPSNAVGSGEWVKWQIPFSMFTGVNMGKIDSIAIGVGDTTPPLHGSGLIYIDNIYLSHEAAEE